MVMQGDSQTPSGNELLGGLIGGPVITLLIRRFKLRPESGVAGVPGGSGAATLQTDEPQDDAGREFAALKSIVIILIAMWAGSWVGQGFSALGLTLPAYIGAMLVASAMGATALLFTVYPLLPSPRCWWAR